MSDLSVFQDQTQRYIKYINDQFPHIRNIVVGVNAELKVIANVGTHDFAEAARFEFEGREVIPVDFPKHLMAHAIAVMQAVDRVKHNDGPFRALEVNLLADARLIR